MSEHLGLSITWKIMATSNLCLAIIFKKIEIGGRNSFC